MLTMRRRTGFIVERNDRIYIRVGYTNSRGRRRDLLRAVVDEEQARYWMSTLLELANDLASAPQGFVYAVREVPNGLIKIGYSEDALRRISQLQGSSPRPLMPLGYWPAHGGKRAEARAHQHLWRFHSHGEWFHPAPFVLNFIQRQIKEPRM
jgi:Meiotically Up-regulated Gene 113 (MUG113) protein